MKKTLFAAALAAAFYGHFQLCYAPHSVNRAVPIFFEFDARQVIFNRLRTGAYPLRSKAVLIAVPRELLRRFQYVKASLM